MNTFFCNSIDANTFDTSFKLVLPDAMRILVTYFLFSMEISKRAPIFLGFQKIIICESAGIFEAQKPRESRLFLFSKMALAVSTRFQAVLLFQGGRLFSFSHTIIPCLKKGAGGNGGKT